MAKYLATKPSYIDGIYRDASPAYPVEVDLADGVEPSRGFEPLDKAAQAALEKLGVKKALARQVEPAKLAAPAPKDEGKGKGEKSPL